MTATAKEEANKALKPLVAWANNNFGAKTRLAATLSKATGQKVTRQSVQNWLHPDPAKRVEPMLGIGLILLRVGAGYTLTKSEAPRAKRGLPKALKLAAEIEDLRKKKNQQNEN